MNTPSRKRRRERTFASELVVLDESDLLALHAARTVAARTARLDGVTLQVLGQPAQVAVADERVASQVPTHTHTHTHTHTLTSDIHRSHTPPPMLPPGKLF